MKNLKKLIFIVLLGALSLPVFAQPHNLWGQKGFVSELLHKEYLKYISNRTASHFNLDPEVFNKAFNESISIMEAIDVLERDLTVSILIGDKEGALKAFNELTDKYYEINPKVKNHFTKCLTMFFDAKTEADYTKVYEEFIKTANNGVDEQLEWKGTLLRAMIERQEMGNI